MHGGSRSSGGIVPQTLIVFMTDGLTRLDPCTTQANNPYSFPDGGGLAINNLLQMTVYDPNGLPIGSPYTSLTVTQENNYFAGGGSATTANVQAFYSNDTAFEASVNGNRLDQRELRRQDSPAWAWTMCPTRASFSTPPPR